MCVLLLFSAFYYKERMLLCDAAHIFLRIANDKHLQIQQLRLGSFITQIVPLVAVKLHVPLKYALLAYSLSFNLFYLLVMAVLIFGLRNYRLSILMAFYYLLMATDTFYWPNNEVHQGMAWMFLFFGILLRAGARNADSLSLVLIVFLIGGLALMTHALVSIPFVFLLVFFTCLGRHDWPFSREKTIVIFVSAIIMLLVRILVIKYFAGYDSGLLSNLPVWKARSFREAFTNDCARALLANLRTNFWLLPVFFLIGAVSLIKRRKYFLLIWTTIFSISFFLVCCVAFSGFLAFYIESEVMPLSILACTPFVYISLSEFRRELVWAVLFFAFAVRIQRIHTSSYLFTSRYRFLNDVVFRMEQRGINKLALIRKTDLTDQRFMLDWGVPAESLLASALLGQNPQKTLYISNAETILSQVPHDRATFITTHDVWRYENMNRQYFRIDTASKYVILPFDDFIAPLSKTSRQR